jgi:hypothetical protein
MLLAFPNPAFYGADTSCHSIPHVRHVDIEKQEIEAVSRGKNEAFSVDNIVVFSDGRMDKHVLGF